MQITRVCAIPMSDPVPAARHHRTDLGTKVKSDATLIRVETNTGWAGVGAVLGTPPVVAAIVEHELAPDIVGEDPMFSERLCEKMYNGSRATPALERGVTQPEVSRRRGVVMEAIAGSELMERSGASCIQAGHWHSAEVLRDAGAMPPHAPGTR
jgi:L-alanine-DL-glutamate epimerase-like enolase superfamily enzyme